MDVISYLLGKKSSGGGADLSEYFNSTVEHIYGQNLPAYQYTIKKLPPMQAGNSLQSAFQNSLIFPEILDASNTTNFSYCFSQAPVELGDLDLSGWTFPTRSNTTLDFKDMFSYSNLTSIDLSSLGNLDTYSQIFMQEMFVASYNLKKIDLSNFSCENEGVLYCSQMFGSCDALEEIDLSSLDFRKIAQTNLMFNGVPANCLIYVKDQDQVDWFGENFPTLTNVQIKGA